MVQENLLYRRQFILGTRFISSFEAWGKIKIKKNLLLTVHNDLEVTHCNIEDKSLTLLGFIIDPANPNSTNKDIVKRVITQSNTFEDLLTLVYPYTGRWVLIYSDIQETKILHDPCGTRQVYYAFEGNNMWCASQPSLIAEILNSELDTDYELQEYIKSDTFNKNERQLYGDGTVYKDIKQLLPNHYLDINIKQVRRYWIDKEQKEDIETIVKMASEILQGSFEAIIKRYNTMMPITAGWDSRLLLAASKKFKKNIFYYVSSMNILSPKHRDIDIPKKLSTKLNLNLKVIENLPPLSNELKIFIERNVTLGRTYLPKALTIQYHFENNQNRVNIGGNASGIVKLAYGINHPYKIDGEYLAGLMGLSSYTYIISALDNWLKGITSESIESGLDIPDLFYWEQRMGKWGTMYQAEQDIAVEEFLPFNNRQLIMLLAKVDKEQRKAPSHILYQKIIENLWSEVLSEPFNPESFNEKTKRMIAQFIPNNIKKVLKKLVKN